jgi:dinuclear metal center YbgI/SA1388 family protein
MVSRKTLGSYIDELLDVGAFRDYCPNGLQVEGREQINKLVSGVTASQALLDAAIEVQADAILVHHGYFWKGESQVISGIKKRRIKRLLDADVSLFAYHLPLDAHPAYGNNAGLAAKLELEVEGRFGGEGAEAIGMVGKLNTPQDPETFATHVEACLNRKPMHIAGKPGAISSIAWCTGAAQGYIEKAVELGVDAYLSGEISEQTVHIARETGVHFFSAGHHATERYGVDLLGQHLAEYFDLDYQFMDIDNPV